MNHLSLAPFLLPVIEDDIIEGASEGGQYAIFKSRFSASRIEKVKQWRQADTRDFDGLQDVLLKAGTLGETGESRMLKSAPPKLRKSRRPRRKKPKGGAQKKDARVARFIKAARFVRGHGASSIHPSAKIRLHGLLMQAKKGDCPSPESDKIEESGPAVLGNLKRDAWRAVKGKGQEEAMKEYVELLTSLAPNWKVAHIVLGRETEEQST